MQTQLVAQGDRPKLVINLARSRSLGRCYSEVVHHVTSLSPLSKEKLVSLFEAGLVGIGQEFDVAILDSEGKSKPLPAANAVQDPSGVDLLEFVEVYAETGKPTGRPAINSYTKKPMAPARQNYYTYECIVRCDSSG